MSRNANSRLASQTWSFGPRVASWKFDKRDDVDWGPAGVQTTRSVWILERSPGYVNEIKLEIRTENVRNRRTLVIIRIDLASDANKRAINLDLVRENSALLNLSTNYFSNKHF